MIRYLASNLIAVTVQIRELSRSYKCENTILQHFSFNKICKMSFSGKKYRRIRSENVEELVNATNSNKTLISMLTSNAPIFSFTRIDENTFNFTLQMQTGTMSHDFKLGQEIQMERRDGTKVRLTYTLESDNVLKQVIVPEGGGRVAYFRREFGDNGAKMSIRMDGSDIEATVYFELVE